MNQQPACTRGITDVASLRILLVDDEEPLLNLFTMALEELGYIVLTAHNGRDALVIAEREQPALIISDIMMPLLDGQAMSRALRERDRTRNIPIILMSAARPSNPTTFADHFLPKPFELDQLEEVIETTLRAQQRRNH